MPLISKAKTSQWRSSGLKSSDETRLLLAVERAKGLGGGWC